MLGFMFGMITGTAATIAAEVLAVWYLIIRRNG